MSEQTIQEGLYSIPVQLDKYICRSLGATTIKDLVKNKEVTGLTIKECDKIKANRPDVLILNKDKQIVVFIEMKEPDKLKTEKLQRLAKYQELGVARQVKAKIYMLSDGETFIWINPITGARITDENDKPITRKINPKNLSPEQNKELAEFIDDVCYCINDSNNKIMPKEYIDPTPLAQKVARILQNMSLSSAKNSLYTFVEFFTFKFLSDISVLRGIYSFEGIYSVYAEQSSKDAFIQYLTTVRKKLLELFPYNPEDGTTIINKIQSYPVYTYLCSTIGETMDTYRFDIDENDLHDAVDLYNLYRGNKENKIAISAVNDNPRAKLIPVDKFGIEENWNIELFWSDEEKIELGIKKKDTIMSLEEFHGYISELIDDIKNYQEAIECLK